MMKAKKDSPEIQKLMRKLSPNTQLPPAFDSWTPQMKLTWLKDNTATAKQQGSTEAA